MSQINDAPTAYNYKPFRPLKEWYIGTVVENDDPKGLGCVKVEIPGLTRGIDKKYLPWYHIVLPTGLGGSSYSHTNFGIPQVNTLVMVFFPSEDIYSGLVHGFVLNRVNFPDDRLNLAIDYLHPKSSEHHFTKNWDKVDDTTPNQKHFAPDMSEDYPFCWGWVDPAMNWMKINMMKRTWELVLNSMTKVKNYWNGNTVVHITGNLKVVVEKDFYLEVRGNTDMIFFNSVYQHNIGNWITMTEHMSMHESKRGRKEQDKLTSLN